VSLINLIPMTKPIKTRKNQYLGVNPHLQSFLQTPGSEETGLSLWPSFHSNHVSHIADFLNEVLPSNYIAYAEQSLQIRTEDIDLQYGRTRKPEPDITIYRHSAAVRPLATAEAAIDNVPFSAVLDDTLDLSEDFVKAVLIREVQIDERLGQVITRIELLLPSNKPGGAGYEAYRKGRNDALYSHIPLVELDYLHESPPPVMKYPIYPYHTGSHPYNIFVSDPRPSVHAGRLTAYGFDVDAPFPEVILPLAGSETLPFDFGTVYQHTYLRGRRGQSVDYTQPPVRFETYSAADQERIKNRMAAIAEAYARGDDLEA
jgi:hypothetical protein